MNFGTARGVLSALLVVIWHSISMAQGGWSWTPLPPMPMPTANNAVAAAVVNDTTYVYSFLGIGAAKNYTAIHQKAFRYNTISQWWDTIPDVPDSLGGLIAASATTIRNKIYIIGGYHVYSNQSEISSYQVHIYDPVTNTYTRGANIPIEIDDHVQIGYNDSLIYVITGWTSSLGGGNNTNAVQVYDAVLDTWHVGTPTPDNAFYKAFGASGTLVRDTIYYAGGAIASGSFPLAQYIRKGVIDPANPLNITWSYTQTPVGFKPYRAASVLVEEKICWIGGSAVSYNYDGLAYAGGAGVEPYPWITEHNAKTNKWDQYGNVPHHVMDLRGAARVGENQYIVCGGMSSGQTVSDSIFLLEYDTTFLSSTDSVDSVIGTAFIFNTLAYCKIEKSDYIYRLIYRGKAEMRLLDMFGRTIRYSTNHQLNVLGEKGFFLLHVTLEDGRVLQAKIYIN